MPLDVNWIKTHKGIAIAGAGGVAALALYMRKKNAASAAAGAPASATVSGTSGYDSSVLDAYGSLSSEISQLQGQVDTLASLQPAPSNGVAPSSGAPATPYGGISGYEEITNPQAGSAYAAAGDKIFVLPAGMPQTAASLVPFMPGAHYAPGSHEYIQG